MRAFRRRMRARSGAGRPGRSRDAEARVVALPKGSVLSGRAHVIDGDTIVVQGRSIRLAGIDAPELDRPFGRKAKWAMVEICRNQPVTVRLTGETSYDRLVGTCYLPDGRDIGAELIREGLALDWTYHSGGRYLALERPDARRKLRGCGAWGNAGPATGGALGDRRVG